MGKKVVSKTKVRAAQIFNHQHNLRSRRIESNNKPSHHHHLRPPRIISHSKSCTTCCTMSGKSSKGISQEEIAKKFNLPERQSKIASLLKEPELYCLCQSTDSTGFMISCDHCQIWFHGRCISITESAAKNIDIWYCPACMQQDPSVEIIYKKKPLSSSVHREKSSTSSRKPSGKSGSRKDKKASKPSHSSSKDLTGSTKNKRGNVSSSNRCGSCPGCLAVIDCMKCDICAKSSKKGRICRNRECIYKDDPVTPKKAAVASSSSISHAENTSYEPRSLLRKEDDDEQLSIIDSEEYRHGTKEKPRKGYKDKTRKKRRTKRITRETSSSPSDHYYSDPYSDTEEDEQQCYGLDCINAARKNSKYCSQECCIKLATERIYRILPGRIQEWNLTTSVAEDSNRKELEEIRTKQNETKNRISELERKRADLDRHVQNVQLLEIDPDADDEPEEEGIIHCITCGHEIAVRSCIKHMERCYNKYESQTSFGSIYKTKLEGTPIFCDFYNPANGTYCKRLAVLCPEHSKEAKIRDGEVCGCPVVTNLTETWEKFCRLSKKKCNKHFCWEKLRRAEIDMERVRSWLKLDELLEQERQIRLAMSNRGGVMGLLLHSTFDHDLRNRIQTQMKEAEGQQHQQQQEKAITEAAATAATAAASTLTSLGEEDISSSENDEDLYQHIKDREKEKAARKSGEKDNAPVEITASRLYKKMMDF